MKQIVPLICSIVLGVCLFSSCTDEPLKNTEQPETSSTNVHTDSSIIIGEVFASILDASQSRTSKSVTAETFLKMSDSELDSLKTVYVTPEALRAYDELYANAIQRLINMSSEEEAAEFLEFTRTYRTPPEGFVTVPTEIASFSPAIQEVAHSYVINYNQFINTYIDNEPMRFGCTDMLYLELTGTLAVAILEIDSGVAVFAGPETLAAVIDALSKYKWCLKTGQFI
jgi:hypothetical protein